ncbi:MAG: hypothetical protein J4431_01120 [Candidatus Aenigmarchaeota archaeon]|nr:hypothetical protein [Candidatus Aenigmarchaeota archaeon]
MFKVLMKEGKDWKEFLAPRDEEKINDILKKVARHRGAYSHAEDMRNAQLWCAILELSGAQQSMEERLSEMEGVFETMFQRMRFREDEKRELHRSLETF